LEWLSRIYSFLKKKKKAYIKIVIPDVQSAVMNRIAGDFYSQRCLLLRVHWILGA